VPPLQRTLSLEVTPREKELEPGGETTVLDLVLTDAGGRPVSDAELAVVVVDEAILALTNYQLADPVASFYRTRSGEISSTYGRASIVLASARHWRRRVPRRKTRSRPCKRRRQREAAMPTMAPAPEQPAAGEADRALEAEPIRVRTDFNPLATFAPEVRTDAEGRAQVPSRCPTT
jgi:alpha-2-macroglobulin